jgi:hypothetical protein
MRVCCWVPCHDAMDMAEMHSHRRREAEKEAELGHALPVVVEDARWARTVAKAVQQRHEVGQGCNDTVGDVRAAIATAAVPGGMHRDLPPARRGLGGKAGHQGRATQAAGAAARHGPRRQLCCCGHARAGGDLRALQALHLAGRRQGRHGGAPRRWCCRWE